MIRRTAKPKIKSKTKQKKNNKNKSVREQTLEG